MAVRFTEEEAELIGFWAKQSDQKPAEWARDQVLKGLNSSGPSQTEVVLAEVCGMSNLLAEFMAEMLVFACLEMRLQAWRRLRSSLIGQ